VSLLKERVAKSRGEAASLRAIDAPVAIALPSAGDAYFVSRSPYMSFALAPDGKRVAVFRMPAASSRDEGPAHVAFPAELR